MTTGTQEHNMSKGADVLLASQDGTVLAGHVAATRDGQIVIAVDGPVIEQRVPHGGPTGMMAALGALLIVMARLPLALFWTPASVVAAWALPLAVLTPSP